MEQIVVFKPGGSTLRLNQYTNNSGYTSAEQVCEVLGQDVVNITVKSAAPIDFSIGDYIDVFGFVYKINATPHITKRSDRDFEYELRFEGPQYDLIKVQYLDIDSTGFSTGTSFALMGNLLDFMKLLVRNGERVYGLGSWALGDCPSDTLTQNLTFDNETCLQVLQRLCESYDQYYDTERTPNDTYILHIRKNTVVLPDTFRYGRAKGLYELERQTVSNKNIATRLFAFGSTRNISPNYRTGSPRLKMPFSSIINEGVPAIDNPAGISDFGIIETSAIFEEIYPHRTGIVSAVPGRLQFNDYNMNFNLLDKDANGNDKYLLNGIEPKIRFNTGNLAGYEFTLDASQGYDPVQQLFTILPYTDSRGYELPSTDLAFRIQPGDEYVILDINLPQSYIDAAEQELLDKAQKYLLDNSKPWVQYDLDTDENYIKSRVQGSAIANYFNLANYIKVIDADLGINGNLQITGFTRQLRRHYEYKLALGETTLDNRKRSIRKAAVNNGVYNNTPTKSSINATAVNISNTVATSGSIANAFKKTKSTDYQTQIDSLWDALAGLGPVRVPYVMPYDTSSYSHADFVDSTVLAIERNESLLGFNQDRNTFALYFTQTVLEGETLYITYRKNL